MPQSHCTESTAEQGWRQRRINTNIYFAAVSGTFQIDSHCLLVRTHTCWVYTFSCLSREITIHYTIMLIPTVFLPYALVFNCYLVTIFFIRIICEKFEFTMYSHSCSFANITCTLSTWLHTCRIVILLLLRKNQAQMKKLWCSSLPRQELVRISNFLHWSTFGSRFCTVRLGHKGVMDHILNYE